ncbi:unnamed protein product, partial [Polarella glacialis]
VQFAFEEEAEAEEGDLPPMHHNLAAFARNQPGFGPASNTFGMQTGWPQGPTSFHSQPMWVQPPGGTVPQTMSQMLSSQPAQGFPPLPPSGSRGQAPVAPGGTNGFTEDELHKLATNEKWTGLPSSFKRAAGEIYQLMRSSGFGSVREWFQSSWLGAPDTQQKRDLFHTATLCDMRIAEYTQSQGANGLAWALSHDDMLEGMLRQLSAAKEYHLTGDSAQASRIIAFRTGNDSVLPSWLQSETREFSNAVHKQELRARPSATKRNADSAPLPLSQMQEHHQQAWRALIHEVRMLCEARRAPGPTGAAALSFYSSEERVLAEGGKDPARQAELRALGRKVGGPRSEYIKYLNREDVKPLWEFCSQKEARACCSFKAENCFTYVVVPPWMRLYQCAPAVRHYEVGGSTVTAQLSAPCPGCKSHQVLRGSTLHDGKWKPWSAVASPYPALLVSRWSKLIADCMEVKPSCQILCEQLVSPFSSVAAPADIPNLNSLAGCNLNIHGLGGDRLLTVDKVARYSHIDDHLTLGCDSELVQQVANAWAALIRKRGFIVKEPPVVAAIDRYIGYSSQVTPARWKLPLRTLLLLDRALDYLDLGVDYTWFETRAEAKVREV